MAKTTRFAALLTGLTLLPAATAAAQEADTRWGPWIGCWQAIADEETPATDDLLCIRPAPGGVEMVEVVDGRSRSVQTLIADGRPRDVTAEGCSGWLSVEFALDGRRLFTRAEQACESEPLGPSTGVIAMVSPREWIDVQATAMDGRSFSWVRRFRPARPALVDEAGYAELVVGGAPSAAARLAAAAPDVDDVIEASGAVDPEAVRAWVAEMRDPFDLDARRLIRLADAGVPESVIDVMVAVSYPDRFALRRDGDIDEISDQGPRRAYASYGYRRTYVVGGSSWYRRPFYPSPFYYSPYGYGYGYPYGYGYGYGGYYRPGVVVVVPRGDDEPDARVVRGRGYVRGRSGSDASSGSGPASAPSRRGGSTGGSSVGGSSGSSAPTSARPSSGGSRSGSSTGRTAKPRER